MNSPEIERRTNGSAARVPSLALERRADGFFHRTVDVGEVRLHVAEARPAGAAEVPADAPLVVFLHGFPEFWWSWRHQLRALAEAGFWAVAPDMRGYNESDKPAGVDAYRVEKLAGDVAGLIRALGRERAFVVGHDWGAVVAWAFAQEHPSLLERLAILNVPHPLAMMRGLRRPEQLKKSWYIFFFQLPVIPEKTASRSDFAFLRRTFELDGTPSEEIEQYVDAIRVPGALTSAINYYRSAIRRVVRGDVPKSKVIDRPVLVIWGDRDRYLGKEMAEPPARFVPNARVVHLPESTHWVQNDAPEKVNALLLEFFREGKG
mgnify:CR=1 FL=1